MSNWILSTKTSKKRSTWAPAGFWNVHWILRRQQLNPLLCDSAQHPLFKVAVLCWLKHRGGKETRRGNLPWVIWHLESQFSWLSMNFATWIKRPTLVQTGVFCFYTREEHNNLPLESCWQYATLPNWSPGAWGNFIHDHQTWLVVQTSIRWKTIFTNWKRLAWLVVLEHTVRGWHANVGNFTPITPLLLYNSLCMTFEYGCLYHFRAVQLAVPPLTLASESNSWSGSCLQLGK